MINILLSYSRSEITKRLTVNLPSSKSESNRALIINALSKQKGSVQNLSDARDTQTLIRLLDSRDFTFDVLDAGTTMRFLTAYLAVTSDSRILTGTARMQERPIKILVDALKKIGAKIEYLGKDGYPPIQIAGIERQLTNQIEIKGNISSQYISAILMIAPVLSNGLAVTITGKIGSKPYIDMTLKLMEHFGVVSASKGNTIFIKNQNYTANNFTVESDWSAASYWYSIFALADDLQELHLPNLKEKSFQGDQAIAKLMEHFGVTTKYTEDGVTLTKSNIINGHFKDNFTDCPDLAQTIIVLCAAKGISGEFFGLESLKIKETDRTKALQTELGKIGADFYQTEGGQLEAYGR